MDEQIKLAKASFSIFGTKGFGDVYSPTEVDKMETFDLKEFNKVVEQCRFFYRKDPIAGTVINKTVDIGITKLIFDQGKLNDNEFRIFEGVKESLEDFAESCGLEYLISGLVIPEIKFAAVNKEFLVDLGIKKYTTLDLPVSMWLRDPATVKINSSMIMDDPSYYVILPDELVFFIMNEGEYSDGTRDKELYEKLKIYYPEFVKEVKEGAKEILLENNLIIRRKPLSDSPYPIPYLYNSLEALKHKRELRRMDYSIASRVISAIMLVKLGNDVYPVTEDEEDAFSDIKSQMKWRYSAGRNIERIFQLFANHTLEIEWVFPPIEALISEKKYGEVNQDIFFSLGFPRILTTGETERSGSSDPEFASLSPVKSMENMRKKILKIIRGIIKEIAHTNKLKNYPEIRFTQIDLHAFKSFVTAMTTLYDTGNISRTSFSDSFGYNWEEEMKKKEDEQKLLGKLDLPEFSPKPYSPSPNKPNNKDNKDEKDEGKLPNNEEVDKEINE